jgi:hypothetical protein
VLLPSYSLLAQARSLLGPLPESIRPYDHFSLIRQSYKYVSLLRHSTFVECITARQRLRENLLCIQERNDYLIPASIFAAIEIGSFELALSFLGKKCFDVRTQASTDSCKHYIETLRSLSGKHPALRASESPPMRALVMGPASFDQVFLDSSIQDVDIIATPDLTAPLAYGVLCKSIYLYVNNYKAKVRTSEVEAVVSHCDRVLFKTHASMRLLTPANDGKLSLMACPDNILLEHYGTTMIPTILYDLLLRGCSSLSLVGTTFYAYGSPYRQSYKSNDLSCKSILASIRGHDPFPGFNLCVRLFQHGILEAEPDCSELLSSGELYYAAMLDKVFF